MKNGPAKKAPTPRGKYKRRAKKPPIEEKINMGGGDFQLFKVQEYTGPINPRAFRNSDNYRKIEEAIKKLKPKEAFIIKDEWKQWPQKILRELQLKIKITVIAVAGNDAYRRVVRLH